MGDIMSNKLRMSHGQERDREGMYEGLPDGGLGGDGLCWVVRAKDLDSFASNAFDDFLSFSSNMARV